MDDKLIRWEGGVPLTQSGNVYVEQLADTLHRIKTWHMSLLDGSTRALNYKEHKMVESSLGDPSKRFIKLKTGEIIAIHQIKTIKPIETIIDTRKDVL